MSARGPWAFVLWWSFGSGLRQVDHGEALAQFRGPPPSAWLTGEPSDANGLSRITQRKAAAATRIAHQQAYPRQVGFHGMAATGGLRPPGQAVAVEFQALEVRVMAGEAPKGEPEDGELHTRERQDGPCAYQHRKKGHGRHRTTQRQKTEGASLAAERPIRGSRPDSLTGGNFYETKHGAPRRKPPKSVADEEGRRKTRWGYSGGERPASSALSGSFAGIR